MSKKNEDKKEVIKDENIEPGKAIDVVKNPELEKFETSEVLGSDLDMQNNVENVKAGSDLEEELLEEPENENVIMKIKLKGKHPNDAFRIGSVVVSTYVYAEYELNQEEQKELLTDGPAHWLDVEGYDLKDLIAKKKAESKKK